MAPYVYPFEALLAGTSPGSGKVTSAARQACDQQECQGDGCA
jgi:hypothetical protein